MDFATNLRRICQEKNTSPTAVCLSLGLSSSKVNLWNNGSLPKPDVLVKLAQALDCTVMEFFADDEDIEKMRKAIRSEMKTEFSLDDDEQDVIRLFRLLSRKQKHEFMTKAYQFEESMHKK